MCVSAHRFKGGPHGWVGVPAVLHELAPAWRWLGRIPLLPRRHEVFGIGPQQKVGGGGALHVLLHVQASVGPLPGPELPHDDPEGIHIRLQEQHSYQSLRSQRACNTETLRTCHCSAGALCWWRAPWMLLIRGFIGALAH